MAKFFIKRAELHHTADYIKNVFSEFYCNMDEFIETNRDKIKCWIYGHTHTPSNITIDGIPFLCNPIGYPNENVNINFQSHIKIGI